MPIPDVPWGGRDTSALAHELIHRWVHEGADPAAIDAARARHAARGEDLRVAARALERAQSDLGGAWQGRNAEAAGAHLRSLVARMSGLSDAVSGQASSLGAIRDALTRVQAAVRSPRPPVFGPLRAPPAAAGLGEAVLSGPRDGFGLFQTAQAEERAAQAAYQAYLRETSVAARATPPAMEVALARVPVPTASAGPGAPETAAPARGAAARVPGSGALARAAAAEPAVPGAPGTPAAPGAPPGTSPGAPGAARVPPGAAPTPGAAAVGGASPSGPATRPGAGGTPEVPGRAAPPGVPAPAAGGTGGTFGRVWQRILGPELGTARATPGAPPRPGPAGGPSPGGPSPGGPSPGGPPSGTAAGGDVGLPAGGVGGARLPAPRRRDTDPRARTEPSGTTPATAADRLAAVNGGSEQDGGSGQADRAAADGGPEGTPASWSNPTAPGAHTGMSPSHGVDPPGGAPAGPALPAPSTGTGSAPLPGAGPAGAGGAGGVGDDSRPASRRHPEYLVEADPWGEGDDARLVTPPVLGAEDDR